MSDDSTLPMSYDSASVGDVLHDSSDRPILDGWHECDGSVLTSYEWPQFVEALRIKGPTFTLPKPERELEGFRWLIRLGDRRPIPTTTGSRDLLDERLKLLRRG